MLARRAFACSAPHFKSLFNTAPGRARTYLPPPTFLSPRTSLPAKILYRKDGTPRSKRKGFAIGLTTTLVLLVLSSAMFLAAELQEDNNGLRTVVHFQRVKIAHGSADLSQYENALHYFEQLCLPLLTADSQELFKEAMTLANALKDEIKTELHASLKSLLEEIDRILTDECDKGEEEDFAEAGEVLLTTLVKGVVPLEEALRAQYGDENKATSSLKGDALELKGSKYEILG